MDYSNPVCTPEDPPRSQHHAAMLVLEQRTAHLKELVNSLARALEPALHPAETESSSKDAGLKEGKSNVQVIAHVDAVCRVVDNCISQAESLLNRLVI